MGAVSLFTGLEAFRKHVFFTLCFYAETFTYVLTFRRSWFSKWSVVYSLCLYARACRDHCMADPISQWKTFMCAPFKRVYCLYLVLPPKIAEIQLVCIIKWMVGLSYTSVCSVSCMGVDCQMYVCF